MKNIKVTINKVSTYTYLVKVLVCGVLKVYTYQYDAKNNGNIRITSCGCWNDHDSIHLTQAETDACWHYGLDWIIEELNRRSTEAEARALIS